MRSISIVCILCLLLQGCAYVYRPVPITQKEDNILTCPELLKSYEVVDKKADKLRKSQEFMSGVILAPLYPFVLIYPMIIMYIASFKSSELNAKAANSYFCRKDNLMKLIEEKDCPREKYRSRSEYAFIDNVITGRRDYVSEYCLKLK